MSFTKTSQKFGQWTDTRANTVYGLGFSSEQELNKVFIITILYIRLNIIIMLIVYYKVLLARYPDTVQWTFVCCKWVIPYQF